MCIFGKQLRYFYSVIELREFLAQDKTDQIIYDSEHGIMCFEFVENMIANANKLGFKMYMDPCTDPFSGKPHLRCMTIIENKKDGEWDGKPIGDYHKISGHGQFVYVDPVNMDALLTREDWIID